MIPTKVSTIVLDTADLSSDDKNGSMSEFVFRNIDFDQLMGDDWRENDLFNIVLVSTVFDKMDSADIDSSYATPEVRLSGIPIVDSDVRVNRSTAEIALCTVDISKNDAEAFIENYPGGLIWTMKREDENLFDFKFRLVNPNTDATLTNSSFPRQLYVFKVYHI